MKNNLYKDIYAVMRKAGEGSLYNFAKLFMPEHLKYLPSIAHREIYQILEEITVARGKKVALAAPRNFGKTSLVMLIYIIYLICYGKEKFIVILSGTQSQAMQTLENIRKELTENERLRKAFPEIFESEGRPKPPRWKRDDIVTRNGIEILALGRGQQIRGRKYGNARPGLIAVDDLESDAITSSNEGRDKLKNWFTTSVLRAGSEETNFLLLGNIFHPFSLLGEYTNQEISPGWISRVYKAVISWPVHMDFWGKWENIYRGRETYKDSYGPKAALQYYKENKTVMDEGSKLLWPERHMLYDMMVTQEEDKFAFMCEMQNSPIDLSMLIFYADEYDHWTDTYRSEEELLHNLANNAEFFLACDPAVGESKGKGDFSAIVIIVRDKRDKVMYMLKADIKRRKLDELIKDIISYYKRYKFLKIGIESNNFQTLLVTALENEAKKEGLYLPIEKINNHGNKIDRISTLQPILKNGLLKLNKNDVMLHEEMRVFPKGLHEDGLDATEICVRLCENTKNEFMFWFGDVPGYTSAPHGGSPLTLPADGSLVVYKHYQNCRPY